MVNFCAQSARFLAFAFVALGSLTSAANADPLATGWALNASASKLTFGSEHSGTVSETHNFTAYSGAIDPNGSAEVKIRLASVDTQDDMRDVRLRFLFFEAFKYPEATIRAQISSENLTALEKSRRAIFTLPFTLDLHGVTREMSAAVVASLDEGNTVTVTPVSPIKLQGADFGFDAGFKRLEDAFYGTINPEFSVGFEFVFARFETDLPMVIASPVQPTKAETPAVQTAAACESRLSKVTSTGQVTFQKGSFNLTDASKPLLAQVIEIAQDCEGLTIRVEGHTDSVGKEASNQSLSERRAESVARYLVNMGVPEQRVGSKGLGEKFPVAPNDTADNRAKNRRIEFHIDLPDQQG